MYSGEGEEVKLFSPISPTENVEDWLLEVEKSMKASVRDNIEKSIGVYPEVRVLSWTGRSLVCWFQSCHRGHQRWGWWTWDVFCENILFYSTFKTQLLIQLCACKCRMVSWARSWWSSRMQTLHTPSQLSYSIEQPSMNLSLFISPDYLFVRIFCFSSHISHSVPGTGRSNQGTWTVGFSQCIGDASWLWFLYKSYAGVKLKFLI